MKWPRDNYWLYALAGGIGFVVWASLGDVVALVMAAILLGICALELIRPYRKPPRRR